MKNINKSVKSERIGWYFYDWANSAFPTTVITLFLGPYLTSVVELARSKGIFIKFLGFSIEPASYFPLLISVSVVLQFFVFPFVGALADYTNKKKTLLLVFAYIGALSASALFFLDDRAFVAGGNMFILANLCFGAAVIVYNAYLNDITTPAERDAVSSNGWAFGYLGGGTLLALNLAFYSFSDSLGIDKTLAVRINLASAGIWWGLFTLIPAFTLRNRNSGKLREPLGQVLGSSLRKLGATLANARKYPKTLIFLAAYVFYNDGVQSVIALAAQFGSAELGLGLDVLTQVILMVQFVAFFGALLFKYIAKWVGTRNALLISIAIWALALVYAYAGLKTTGGFFLLGGIIGIVLGGSQALSRSLFANLIPIGSETEYFGVYELSERGSSWLGPLFFAFSYELSHSYRLAIFSLIAFFIVGFVILLFVNNSRSQDEII